MVCQNPWNSIPQRENFTVCKLKKKCGGTQNGIQAVTNKPNLLQMNCITMLMEKKINNLRNFENGILTRYRLQTKGIVQEYYALFQFLTG